MNTGAHRFTVNTPDVVHENFDGEVVIINLDSGNYYSLEGSGAFVWDCIAGGMNVDETVLEAQRRFSEYTHGIEGVITAFVDELISEKLVVGANGSNGNAGTKVESSALESNQFEQPILRRFTDMQELLLLDPIHEVDEGGWPMKKGEPLQRA